MKVWKVVKNVNGRLVSAIVKGQAAVEYIPGEWVEAPEWLRSKEYHLLAFQDLSEAIDFAKLHSATRNLEIWEAEAEDLVPLPFPLDISRLSVGLAIRIKDYWPTGTIMCRRLKLLKRVWVC